MNNKHRSLETNAHFIFTLIIAERNAKNLCCLLFGLFSEASERAREAGRSMDFSLLGERGKRLFSRALRFSPGTTYTGAIVYFLIFLLFAFRRFKSATITASCCSRWLSIAETIEREIRSCRVVLRFLLFNFFPVTRARLARFSLPPSIKRRSDSLHPRTLFVDGPSILRYHYRSLRANLFILDRVREALDMRYIRHALSRDSLYK